MSSVTVGSIRGARRRTCGSDNGLHYPNTTGPPLQAGPFFLTGEHGVKDDAGNVYE
jgi:hypothetical protein